jgi:hypothetical protein
MQKIMAEKTEPVIYWGGKWIKKSEFAEQLLGAKEDHNSSLNCNKTIK